MAPEVGLKLVQAGSQSHHQQNESQDSQAFTMYMHRLHGGGDRSSSPAQPYGCDQFNIHIKNNLVGAGSRFRYVEQKSVPRDRSITVKNPAIAATATAKDKIAPAGSANLNRPLPTARASDASNNRAFIASSQQSEAATPSRITTSRIFCQTRSKAISRSNAHESSHHVLNTQHRPADHGVQDHHDSDDDDGGDDRQHDPAAIVAAIQPFIVSSSRGPNIGDRREKMDLSQSPTQSNDGRSYEQYLPRGDDLFPSDGYELEPLPDTQPSVTTSPSKGTTRDNDTGVVDFDFSAMGRQDTQVSDPDAYNTDRLQQTSPTAFQGLPETPAPPRNPFADSKDSKASLMAASQMFRQTQTSSAHKTFSPTSSRPSPDNFQALHSLPPHSLTSSPLKQTAAVLSPIFARFPDVYNTSPKHAVDELLSGDESRENHPPLAGHASEDGSDPNLAHKARRRRRQGNSKAMATERRLRPVTLPQPSTSDKIVPSTNKQTIINLETEQLRGCTAGRSDRESQNAIEETQVDAQDSQQKSSDDIVEIPDLRNRISSHVSSHEAIVPNTASSSVPSVALPAQVHRDAKPSPQHIRPRAIGDMMPNSSGENSKAESFSKLLGSSLANDAKSSQSSKDMEAKVPSGPDSGFANTPLHSPAAIAETSPPVDSSPPPPAFSTRARLRDVLSRSSTNAPTSSPPPASLTSSLSRLGATPELSDKTTPTTEQSPRRPLTSSSTEDLEVSPAVAKVKRRKDVDLDAQTNTNRSKNTQVRTLRSKRSLDVDESTDELAGSPSIVVPSVYQQSARSSRHGRVSLKETPAPREYSRGGALFAGMAFAISFQSKQIGEKDSHYNSRIATSTMVANKIKQGGGKVLTTGFDQLFEVTPVKTAIRESTSASCTPQPDDEICLAPSAQDTGFTALIADGHSRKVKYMQALALGLPCIHERWVRTCVEKQKLVDWSDYLLSAGNSSFLGDAIKSRSLSPYDAATAKLSETTRHRPRLLNQSRILLVMTRAEEQKKMAYVFLARVLGASLSRVYNVDEARKQLKSREDAGHPYDWVYLEEKMTDSSGIFSDVGSQCSVVASTSNTTTMGTSGRKRKRRNGPVAKSPAGPPPKRIRTLSDELVIQSLILGRLMDEDEMTV